MIPRSRVNYGLKDMLEALLVRENAQHFRHRVRQFFRLRFATQNVLLTASGRAGLYWLLRALPQRRVLVPAYTCSAVVQAVVLAGKEAEFVECRAGDFNVDLDQLRNTVSRDCIIVATHQYGIPCQIEEIVQVARAVGAFVVEDVAAALGSRSQRRITGMSGDAAFFSFDTTKLINVPTKAGVLLVRSEALFQSCLKLFEMETTQVGWRDLWLEKCRGLALVLLKQSLVYGAFHLLWFRCRKYISAELEAQRAPNPKHYFLSMPEWQAKIALQQLAKLDELAARRSAVYQQYLQFMRGKVAGLPPAQRDDEVWACVRFPLLVEGNKFRFYERAISRGVDLGFSFSVLATPDSFHASHMIAKKVLNLPLYPDLSRAEQRRVVEAIVEIGANGA